jgi:hypothetical protein
MAENAFDAMPPRNRGGKMRKPYAPPKIIFSELTHSSTGYGPTPIPHKDHGALPGEAHSDSTIGTS